MELQQTLRHLTIVESACLQQVCHHCPVLASLAQVAYAAALVLLALAAERLAEGKLLDIVEEELLEVGSRLVIVGRKERKEILEHTARSSTCRHELHDSMLVAKISAPIVNVLLHLRRVWREDAVAYCCAASIFKNGNPSLICVS